MVDWRVAFLRLTGEKSRNNVQCVKRVGDSIFHRSLMAFHPVNAPAQRGSEGSEFELDRFFHADARAAHRCGAGIVLEDLRRGVFFFEKENTQHAILMADGRCS